MENQVVQAMADAGHGDLTSAQIRLLRLIDPHGSRLTQLAAAAQVTKQTAGVVVNQLEHAGYVDRVPDPADARARLIRRTERAAGVIPVSTQVIADVEARLGAERMAWLRDALTGLGEITGGCG
jgi:DNA-binding MarR family transcriptional regulator